MLETVSKTRALFLGHSIAGQLFPLAKMSNKIKAAYLVASQNVSKNNWSGFSKFKVNIFWHIIIPFCTNLFGYLPAAAYGEDIIFTSQLPWIGRIGERINWCFGPSPKSSCEIQKPQCSHKNFRFFR